MKSVSEGGRKKALLFYFRLLNTKPWASGMFILDINVAILLSYKVKWSCSVMSALCNPMDCSLSGSSIHGIFQARVVEWVAISFSRDISTQGLNPGLLHCRQMLLPSEPPGNPTKMYIYMNWQYFVIYEKSKSLRI